jgi:glycosyltransferase A (GT-A) superfamily protein (DUF2064 family)
MSLHAFTGARSAIIVFARPAVPGKAKTRLVPRLGAWRAARLHARLTKRALQTARAARSGRVELHIRQQRGRDLGERMARAFRMALRRHQRVVLIGTDCPMLTPADLRRAARLLCGACDAVLAPAEDGGYALLALKKVRADLFSGIEWGADTVLRETLTKIKSFKWRYRLLRTVWDLDRPEDLDRLPLWGALQSAPLLFRSAARRSAMMR